MSHKCLRGALIFSCCVPLCVSVTAKLMRNANSFNNNAVSLTSHRSWIDERNIDPHSVQCTLHALTKMDYVRASLIQLWRRKKKHTHLGNKERQFIVLLIAIHSCSIERDHCALHIFASIKWFRLNFAGPLSLVPTLPSLSFVGSIRIGIRANSSRSPSAYDFDRNGNEMWFAWVRNELIGLFDKYEFAKFNK